MHGIAIIWVCAGILAALAVALFVPVRLCVRLETDTAGGAFELSLSQRVWRKRFLYHLSLCAPPCFAFWRVHDDGTAGRMHFMLSSSSGGEYPLLVRVFSELETEELDLFCRIGFFGEPHITALLCALADGAICAAVQAMLPKARSCIAWQPDFTATVFRVNFSCIFRTVPAKIIRILIRKRRYAHATSH